MQIFTNLVRVHLGLKPISTSDATMASHIKYKFCTRGKKKKKKNKERKLNLMMKILQFFSNSIKFNNMANKMKMITVFSNFLLLLSLLDSVTKSACVATLLLLDRNNEKSTIRVPRGASETADQRP